nr:hypothetical protein [Sphingomonas jatrophae]
MREIDDLPRVGAIKVRRGQFAQIVDLSAQARPLRLGPAHRRKIAQRHQHVRCGDAVRTPISNERAETAADQRLESRRRRDQPQCTGIVEAKGARPLAPGELDIGREQPIEATLGRERIANPGSASGSAAAAMSDGIKQ